MRALAALLLLLFLAALSCGEDVDVGAGDGEKLPLSSLTSLQFSTSQFAVSRNGKQKAELRCISGSASGFWWHPDWYPRVVSCVRYGLGQPREALGAEWRCTAKLRDFLELGETRVLCERYEDDPSFILAGSCRLEYALNFTEYRLHFVHVLYGCGLATALFLLYALVRYRSMTKFSELARDF